MSRSAANGSSYEVFDVTMKRLEQALSVGQIATFDFTTCDIDADPKEVLDKHPDYDQIPVQRDGKVVGVLERDEQTLAATVEDAMRPLDVSMLVAAEEPLSRFIDCLLEEPYYRLVLQGQHLNGIVTRSDLLNLPVRLLAFARVTHLELIMADLIAANCPEDSWLSFLSRESRKNIEYHFERLQKDRINIYHLEVSGFEDKYTVLSNLPGLADSFNRDMAEMKELRDELAHSKDFVADEQALERFWERLQSADRWIVELSNRLVESDANSFEAQTE